MIGEGRCRGGEGRKKRKVEERRRVQGYVACVHVSPLRAQSVSCLVSQHANTTGWGVREVTGGPQGMKGEVSKHCPSFNSLPMGESQYQLLMQQRLPSKVFVKAVTPEHWKSEDVFFYNLFFFFKNHPSLFILIQKRTLFCVCRSYWKNGKHISTNSWHLLLLSHCPSKHNFCPILFTYQVERLN